MAEPIPERERLVFTAEEAAHLLGISRAKVYELVKHRHIDYRRPRGMSGVRFTRADIDKYLTDGHRQAVA